MVRTISKNIKKAAVYIRVSTEEQAKEGFSLAAQEDALSKYAENLGYKIFKIYRDEGKSAKDIVHRESLQQLLKDANNKLFNAVLVYKLDRFSRSLKDLILTIEKLKSLNIDFISLQDRIETASASGKLMFHIISSFAEFERDIISERTRFGMVEKARGGGVVSKPALGYILEGGKLIIDPVSSEKVRIIFSEFINSNVSLTKIAKKHGLTTRGVIKVLSNRTYIGETKFKETYAGEHKAIIDAQTFASALDKLHKISMKSEGEKYVHMLNGFKLNTQILDKLVSMLKDKKVSLTIIPIENQQSLIDSAKNTLYSEGFSDTEVFIKKAYITGECPDLSAISAGRTVYVDLSCKDIEKIIVYLEESIDYWCIMSEKCYCFNVS